MVPIGQGPTVVAKALDGQWYLLSLCECMTLCGCEVVQRGSSLKRLMTYAVSVLTQRRQVLYI